MNVKINVHGGLADDFIKIEWDHGFNKVYLQAKSTGIF
jgi:hypothetical protein